MSKAEQIHESLIDHAEELNLPLGGGVIESGAVAFDIDGIYTYITRGGDVLIEEDGRDNMNDAIWWRDSIRSEKDAKTFMLGYAIAKGYYL